MHRLFSIPQSGPPQPRGFFATLLHDFLRFILNSLGVILAGTLAGALIGAAAAFVMGGTVLVGAILGAVAGFFLALIALAVVHGVF